jgi:hypothetical protein
MATTTADAKHPSPVPLKLYEGQDLPVDQLASVAVDIDVKTFDPMHIGVVSIDGKQVGLGSHKGAQILPGTHQFLFIVIRKDVVDELKVKRVAKSFDVLAGHSYVPTVSAKEGTDDVDIALADQGTTYDQNCLIAEYPDKTQDRKNAVGCF